MKFDPEASLGGQEDNSTQNSNNLDQNSKKRRTTSGGTFYVGSGQHALEDERCFEPSPWAIYQNDLCSYEDKPKWFPVYDKHNRALVQKIRAFSYDPIPIANL
jgi:hypothetical protein